MMNLNTTEGYTSTGEEVENDAYNYEEVEETEEDKKEYTKVQEEQKNSISTTR